jgi:hypothetical protein
MILSLGKTSLSGTLSENKRAIEGADRKNVGLGYAEHRRRTNERSRRPSVGGCSLHESKIATP